MLKGKGILYLSLILIGLFAIISSVEATLLQQRQMPSPIFRATPDVVHDLDLWPIFEALEVNRDPNCQLPCWWGLRLGNTSINEVSAFLHQTGFDRHKLRGIYRSIPMETYLRGGEPFGLRFETKRPRLSSFEMHFAFDENDLLLMVVQFRDPGKWLSPEMDRISLGRLLSQLPETPELLVHTDENLQVDLRYMSLLLVSDELGIRVSYEFHDQRPTEEESYLQLCLGLTETENVIITLQDPTYGQSVSQSQRVFIEPAQGSGYRRVEDVYGLNTATFMQYFIGHPDGCLDIPDYKIQ